ncbi:hypothetical protein [Flavobacterium terrisoli]|uniref:hypothetical protein n=1 Tax=Flavobacterium terrisoli TaxID=3242195 RepID=UPI002543CA0C|nr:hypothetical protein [Flavobacterium buctense]
MKKYILLLPEFILLGLTAFWFLENILATNHFNPFAFIVFSILLLQVVFQNKYLGFLMAWLFFLFSLYMVLAVFLEFRDFPTVTSDAIHLLAVGLLMCFLAIGSAVIMFWKYLPRVFPFSH